MQAGPASIVFMESKEQSESDAPATAEASRSWWKAPLRWPRQTIAGIARIPGMFLYLKDFRRWPGQIFALVKANKLTSLTVLASGIAILLPVLTFFFYQSARRQREFGPPVKAEQVLGALESGDYAQTKILAKRLMNQQGLPENEAGVAPFALGAVAVFEAEKMKGKNREMQYLPATRYLEEANAARIPRSASRGRAVSVREESLRDR